MIDEVLQLALGCRADERSIVGGGPNENFQALVVALSQALDQAGCFALGECNQSLLIASNESLLRGIEQPVANSPGADDGE